MKLRKKIKIALFLLFYFFLFRQPSLAVGNSYVNYVNIVNPVRGDEFFDIKPTDILLNGVRIQKKITDEFNLKATWLLRYDVLNLQKFTSYFENGFDGHEFGIFMEVTPQMAKDADVPFPKGGVFWHDANKIFLSGYIPEQRIKLIDLIFKKFKEVFGYFPESAGAWHIDAYSARYMAEKYNVTSVLICADQFSTDAYQIWGGWWGVPYYPSKFNILSPAQTTKNKLDLVVSWWAARDPLLGYGGSIIESTYSVQVNDYTFMHGLDINYFQKLLDDYLTYPGNQFGQVTIGLENDMDFNLLEKGFRDQLGEIAKREKAGEISVVTMSEFSNWYRNNFKGLSPDHFLNGWIMSKDFRLGYFEKDGQKHIRDLRIYNETWPETNLLTANPWRSLSLNNSYKIDTVRFSEKDVALPEKIDLKSLVSLFGKQNIPFKISPFLLLSCYLTILLVTYFLSKNVILFLLILVGYVSISIPLVKSGLVYDYGMGFWGPNGHDGIWHIALIEALSKFSINNPIFSGTTLMNYHFGFDFMTAILHLVTGIPVVNLYFQILPPIMGVLIGILSFTLVVKWTNSTKSALWAVFFVYFGGSWGWLVSWLRNRTLGGESMFWANQSVSTLINPPFALSLIVLLLGLIKFLDYRQNPSRKNLAACVLLLGLLIQIKVYAGVITLGSLFCLAAFISIHRSIDTDAHWKFWKLFGLTLLVSLVIYLPFNLKSSSLLVFSPFWFPHTMLSYSDRFGWFKLESARLAYFQSGKWFKWLLAEGTALIIFVLGNLGTRAIGFVYGGFLIKPKRKISSIEIILISMFVFSFALPLIVIQKGNSWNTIQFFYYFQFLMAIFSGVVMGKWRQSNTKSLKLRVAKYGITAVLAGLTLVTTFSTLKNDYLPPRPPSRISVEELEALNFLKLQREGTVLTYPFNKEWRNIFSEPKPLYAYETTAYVSAFASKPVFLEDEMNLEITGFDWQPRRDESVRFFVTADQEWGRKFIIENKIRYLYLVNGQKINLGLGDFGGKKIFENGEATIIEVE